MSDNDVLISIRGDVSDINAKLADIKGYIGKVKDETNAMASQSKASWALFTAGIASAIYAFQQIIEKAQYFTNAFMGAEAAQMKLAVAMRNQGDYSKESLADLENYAKQIQETTAFEDDHVIAVMANMKTYGMLNAEVKDATKIALDFATAKRDEGMTIEQASELIGKAYVGNTERLKRYGIILDESIPKTDRYAAAMKQLNDRFGGAAQADVETYAGRHARFKNQLQDVAEFIGGVLLKALEAAQFGFSILSVGFWELIEGIMKGVGWLAEKIADFASFVGIKEGAANMRGFSEHLKGVGKEYEAIKNEARKMADANYKAMMSFDNVDKAVSKMKPGSRFKPAPEEDKAAAAAREAWKKTARDIQADMDKEGLDPLGKALVDIDKKISELLEKAAQLPTAAEQNKAKGLIEQFKQAAINTATTESAGIYFDKIIQIEKAWKDILKKREAAKEAEINAQITSLDIAEKEGTYHRDTLNERIKLNKELLTLQENRLDAIDPKDSTAWNAQIALINSTKIKMAELKAEISPVFTALNKYAEEATDVWKNVGGAITNAFKGAEEALTEFVMTGKTNFADFANAIIKDLIRIMIQANITGPLAKGLSGVGGEGGWKIDWGELGSMIVGAGEHRGGVGNEATFYRIVPSAAFANASRYHAGIGPGEKAAILKDDEGVFTPGQMKAMGLRSGQSQPISITVKLDNNTGTPAQTSHSNVKFDGQGYVVSVVLDAIQRNVGGLRDVLTYR